MQIDFCEKEQYTVDVTSSRLSPAALYDKIEQVYRLLSGKVASRSIGSGQGRYLQLLCSKDGVTQAELVPLLGVSPSSASELTDKLLAAGLISREKSPEDKRRLLIYLTDAGRAAAESFRQGSAAALGDAFAVLPEDAQQELYAALSRIAEPDMPAPTVSDAPDMIRPGKRI